VDLDFFTFRSGNARSRYGILRTPPPRQFEVAVLPLPLPLPLKPKHTARQVPYQPPVLRPCTEFRLKQRHVRALTLARVHELLHVNTMILLAPDKPNRRRSSPCYLCALSSWAWSRGADHGLGCQTAGPATHVLACPQLFLPTSPPSAPSRLLPLLHGTGDGRHGPWALHAVPICGPG
jgi:hypothetical protein